MDFNGLHELYLAASGYLREHESGALGLDDRSDRALIHAEYLITQGMVAVPIKLEARAPEMFNRCTVLIARNRAALGSFLADLRSRLADGSASLTILIN